MNYTDEEINLITLCSFAKLSDCQRRVLLSDLTVSSPDFVKHRESLIKRAGSGVYNKVRSDFYDTAYRSRILDGLERDGVKCVTYFSAGYPEGLKIIENPPLVLYCKGDVSLLNTDCFAVVGSRRTLPNILDLCKKTAEELAERFTLVTGIADGADTAVLEGGLKRGKVISVLANGFNFVYPAVNRRLLDKVTERGLAITEYPPATPPKRYYFPIRNRIIAGLAVGTLAVSAGVKSGALITAAYAAEFGREVFAFPYTPGVKSGEGCNKLIKNYGKLVDNTLDIFAYFGLDFKPRPEKQLTESETAVLSAIREMGEAALAAVAAELKTEAYKLIPVFANLEIKGYIVRLGGNRYAAI